MYLYKTHRPKFSNTFKHTQIKMDFSGGILPMEILDYIWKICHLKVIIKLNDEFKGYFQSDFMPINITPGMEGWPISIWYKVWVKEISDNGRIIYDDYDYFEVKEDITYFGCSENTEGYTYPFTRTNRR